MHQQLRATEQPLARKIVSRSDQRSGVRGATLSFMGLPKAPTLGLNGAGPLAGPAMVRLFNF